ncbi:MAG: hydrogenase maturation protease [Deltaproteobacteria bacterium]|nr:hydrogenase maturation protease [Deltaproteobacteria bacterium]
MPAGRSCTASCAEGSDRVVAPLLVVGIGNPSRGDDALGPLFLERLGKTFAPAIARGDVELMTDFQLQIEHALDLRGRERVVFVDASVRAAPPFELAPVEAAHDASISTHAMSPAALLATYRSVLGEPPESWLLAIRADRFELGEGLSKGAEANLEAALAGLSSALERHDREGTATGR